MFLVNKNMKGFQYQDVGLFTFYRQQAEYDQIRQAQKQQLARQKQRKSKKAKQQPEQRDSRNAVPSPPAMQPTKENPTVRAKKYLKELEQSGHKLVYQHKKRQRRYNRSVAADPNSQKSQLNISLNSIAKIDDKIVSSMQDIFAKKKDYSKFNYFQVLDKSPVMPKEFNSIEIFEMGLNSNELTNQHSEDFMRRKSEKQISLSNKKMPILLPELLHSGRPTPSVPVYKREKDRRINHYNPIDIILNNEKFKIREGKKPCALATKQGEPGAQDEMPRGACSVLEIIKKYKMIK